MHDEEDEAAALAELLEANGCSAGDAQEACSSITQLEMFLQDYPKMLALHNFPQLRELRLIDQRLTKVEGLHSCPVLEKLHLTENRIARIGGLEACTALQELYLTSNRISAMQGLEQLRGLKVLWLADNFITSIAGIASLHQLRQLNLARNDIAQLGSLQVSAALTSLNLADNRLGSLQDAVAALSRLTALQELCLADPLWGDCPVAGLCNYQTFVLAALPQLTSLDTLLLAEETKAAAAAAFAKKCLYYSMRARTLQRAAADLRRQAQQGLQARVDVWSQLCTELAYATKLMQSQLQVQRADGAAAAGAGTEAGAQDTRQKERDVATLQCLSQSVLQQQSRLRTRFAADCQLATAGLHEALLRLQLELGSAGNMWLEQDQPGAAWVQACQDLLASRLVPCTSAEGGASCGTPGIKVLSAVRIHNRHLRTQFARHCAGGNTATVNSDAQQVLFYISPPCLAGELMRIAQQGFRGCSEYARLGCHDAAIKLASFIRPALHADAAMQTVLVCKAYVGGSTCPVKGLPVSSTTEAGCDDASARLTGVSPDAYPGVQAVHRTVTTGNSSSSSSSSISSTDGRSCTASIPSSSSSSSSGGSRTRGRSGSVGGGSCSRQHRLWYFFEPAAVLPETIVEFQVISPGPATAGDSSSRQHSSTECGAPAAGLPAPAAAPVEPVLSLCARPLQHWTQQTSGQQLHDAAMPGSQPSSLEGCPPELEAQCRAVLSTMGPASCRKLQQLALLQAHVGSQQLGTLTYLSLQDCGLCNFEGLLGLVPSVVTLVLSFNGLTSLAGLAPGPHTAGGKLVRLDVSHNRLATWDAKWLSGCTSSLTALDAACNCLAQHTDITALGALTQLRELSLVSNPVQQHKAYLQALGALMQLSLLDGQPHSPAAVLPQVTSLMPSTLKASATLWHSDGPGTEPSLDTLGAADWRLQLHSVVLDGKQLQALQGLAAAPNLVALSLHGNLLDSLAGLQGCTRLQQLRLSDNLIADLEPLSPLTSLRQLDLADNLVTSLAPLSAMCRLTQLSVESNRIGAWPGITCLSALVECYAANNYLADIKEAERLAALPSLVVLDLAGNPLVSTTQGYRMLLLYRLHRLKVLDGAPASPAEVAAARAQHAGRLTRSELEAHLGSGCTLSSLQKLELCGLGLTGLGTVFESGPLTQLTSLVLDGNAVSSLAPLRALTRLAVLSISSNRLGDLQPGSLTFAAAAPPTHGSSGVAAAVPSAASDGAGGAQRHLPLLPSLKVLHLASNGLSSLVPLQLTCLSALHSLFVQGNDLTQLHGLSGLVQLRELVADRNRIRFLEAEHTSTLVRLRELRLEDNILRSIIPPAVASNAPSEALVACFPSLAVLHLGGNRLADAADCVDKLCGLPSLVDVSLVNNPLARKQVHRTLLISRCAQLQAIDGQAVTQEERECVEAMTSLASPRRSMEVLQQYNAAMLLAAAADGRMAGAAAPAAGGPATSAAPAPGCRAAGLAGAGAKAAGATGVPTVLNYDALASMAARHGLLGGAAGSLPGASALLPMSVPSIQSGVLILAGPASFGLEGTAISGGGSSGSNGGGGGGSGAGPWAGAAASPSRAAKQCGAGAPGGACSPAGRRTTTGSLPAGGIVSHRAGGFTVRQATFH